jgi:hypothetical protein
MHVLSIESDVRWYPVDVVTLVCTCFVQIEEDA